MNREQLRTYATSRPAKLGGGLTIGAAAGLMAMALLSAAVLTITVPVEGVTLKNTVALVATAEPGAPSVKITLQHESISNKCICPAVEGPAGIYTATFDTHQTPDGPYTMTAQSFEADGTTVRETSAPVRVWIGNTTPAPPIPPYITPAPTPTGTPTPTPTPTETPTPTPTPTVTPFPNDYVKMRDGVAANGERFYSEASGYMRRVRVSGLNTYLLPNRLAEQGAWGLEFMFVQGIPVVHDVRASFNKWYQWNEAAVRMDLFNGTGEEPIRPGGTPTPTPTPTPTGTPTPTPTPTPTVTPPGDPCIVTPLKVTNIFWPSSQSGVRSGSWNSGSFSLVKAGFEWLPSLRFIALDSRGCSLVVIK